MINLSLLVHKQTKQRTKRQNVDLHEQTLRSLLKTICSQSKGQRTIDLSMIVRRIYDVWL